MSTNQFLGPSPPSCSFGLTQDNKDGNDCGGGSTKNRSKVQKKGDAGRMRHKGSPGKVFEIIDLLKTKDQYTIIAKNLKNCGFGGILHICKWSSIPTHFVKWIVANFEKEGGPLIRLSKTKGLKLTAEDVHRVYNLPRGHTRIDLSQCTTEAIIRLRKELHLTGEYSISINVKDLEERLQSLKNVKAWTKAAIIYIIFCLLCPVNSNNASLEYALILEDMDNLTTYNWCQHVLNHVKDGIRETNRLTPTADFHFLMDGQRLSFHDWEIQKAIATWVECQGVYQQPIYDRQVSGTGEGSNSWDYKGNKTRKWSCFIAI